MKRVAAIVIFILAVVMLTACSHEGDIVSVEFAADALKTVYEVDETIGAETVTINLICEKGVKTAAVGVESIVGFDTATCGEKTLTVEYEGFTAEWKYTVEYTEEVGRTVNTAARINLSQEEHPTGISRSVDVMRGELKKISAAVFTVNADCEFADGKLSRFELETSEGYAYRAFYVNSKSVRVLVFATAETDNDIICKINLLGASDATVNLSEISVSDGENDYFLPKTKEV